MRSNTARIAVAVGAIAVIVVLFIVLSGGDDNNDNKTSTNAPAQGTTGKVSGNAQATINVQGGKPVGGIRKLSYTKGDQVRIRVKSDVADEIHIHGYDFKKDVPAGGSVSFSFPAKIEGVFVIELEGKGEQIAQLTVKPS
jgi:FtsP/CotA-like multicopper oxidase with cupredoxin domain